MEEVRACPLNSPILREICGIIKEVIVGIPELESYVNDVVERLTFDEFVSDEHP